MIEIPQQALEIIKTAEQFEAQPYVCPAGYPTIGWGHVIRAGESFTSIGTPRGEALLAKDAAWAARAVATLISVPLTQGQYGALISLVFNIGSGNFQASTIRMLINREEYDEAAAIFWQWRRAKGIILRGLVIRREIERQLFIS